MKPLTPPDLKRCQAETRYYNAFVMGGLTLQWRRCNKRPRWIAQETKPGADGRRGSMSLCGGCRKIMLMRTPAGFAKFTPVKR